jgi:MoaA/NifB/PqqE/SkfB family radical SAM enzyme
MEKGNVFRTWGRVLTGRYPALSVEITRECPLRCPGCYAYEPEHLGDAGPLRSLADFKGQELIDGLLRLMRQYRPLHLSIVGGEPLVRFRELSILLPRLSKMGIDVQLVTSAVRPIPAEWNEIRGLHLVVSVDGLQPDHDARRKPATYERILQNIRGQRVTIHCTVTRQMTQRPKYFEEFMSFWSGRPEVKKVWFSLFTPQKNAVDEEILSPVDRGQVLEELSRLRDKFPKLVLPDTVIEGYRNPPQSPAECLFARATLCFTADLESKIVPCQFGGNPDCTQCGCIASAGLNAVGNYKLGGLVPLRAIYDGSERIGKTVAKISNIAR